MLLSSLPPRVGLTPFPRNPFGQWLQWPLPPFPAIPSPWGPPPRWAPVILCGAR